MEVYIGSLNLYVEDTDQLAKNIHILLSQTFNYKSPEIEGYVFYSS